MTGRFRAGVRDGRATSTGQGGRPAICAQGRHGRRAGKAAMPGHSGTARVLTSFRACLAGSPATWTCALIFCAVLVRICVAQPQASAGQGSQAAFSPLPARPHGDPAKIALGRMLFFDRRISRSQKLSCASCHDLDTNGASAAAMDRGDSGRATAWNTPTLFNSVHNFRFGWKGSTRSLRAFTLQALTTDHLMGGKDLAARRFAADPDMLRRFRKLYGSLPSDGAVADALTAFIGTLVTVDAPFDRWLGGDRTALSPRQQRGLNRFNVLGCASCHQGANLGGNIFQRRGIFHPLGKPDPRYLRVPSLRNVAVTPPYFHDGSVASLPEAVRQMGRAQLDLAISDRDAADIAAFLTALTGRYEGTRLRRAAPGHAR
ncbi:cytochrome-c peroxidase [Sphingomonas rustica]